MATSNLMVVLYVHDMARAMRFYTEVLDLSVVGASPGWSVLACGSSLVGLHTIEDGMPEGTAPFAGLNLEVDDLDRVVASTREAGGRNPANHRRGAADPSGTTRGARRQRGQRLRGAGVRIVVLLR